MDIAGARGSLAGGEGHVELDRRRGRGRTSLARAAAQTVPRHAHTDVRMDVAGARLALCSVAKVEAGESEGSLARKEDAEGKGDASVQRTGEQQRQAAAGAQLP